ncbi:MAG: phosphoenolpyruvate--protein phosphotransferase [Spirochaetaceae bacterium]|nr:phosphoenolpyruvate--protein phosphotransferase [Spirochaetaceae bacterium]
MMRIFQGISASTGIAIGKAYVISKREQHTIPKVKITEDERLPGWNRFEKSIETVINYYKNLVDTENSEQEAVIETYLLMLTDTDFLNQIKKEYNSSEFNVEHIVQKKIDETTSQLRAVGDEYLSERAQDIEEVFEKVLFNMLGYSSVGVESVIPDSIVVAENIMPSEAMLLFRKRIKALVLQEGGVSSHISILARTYGIPSVFGVENPTSSIETGNTIVVDATKSLVIVEPDKSIRTDYQIKQENAEKRIKELAQFISQKAQTKDNVPITIYANIGTIEDAQLAKDEGADGIGLFRTEFMFMEAAEKNTLLDEEEQFKAYKSVLQIMGDKSVTIRTLDAGGDKIINLKGMPGIEEKNPLLGCRAIRFCLQEREIFKTQLKALYRAGIYGNLKILLPMITSPEQIDQTKKIISKVKEELLKEGKSFKDDIPLGVMIETPAAAIISDYLADRCDFFSIGSNDLTQYINAVDRENPDVAHLYDELHPAVLRMIKHSVLSASQSDIPISVCGEMAGREESLKCLVGMGVRVISVSPKLISPIKQILSNFSVKEMHEAAELRLLDKVKK